MPLIHVEHMRRSHQWIMSHTRKSHVTDEFIQTRYSNEGRLRICYMTHSCVWHATHTNKSCHKSKGVMSFIQMNHTSFSFQCSKHTHQRVMPHTYEWFTSHIRMSHLTQSNEPCHSFKWVITHVPSCVPRTHTNELCLTHTNDSRLTYEWVMTLIQMRHTSWSFQCSEHTHTNASYLTHTNESCHTYEWVVSLIQTIQRVQPGVPSSFPTTHTPMSHTSHIHMSHVKHTNESCHSFKWTNQSHLVFPQVFRAQPTRLTCIFILD